MPLLTLYTVFHVCQSDIEAGKVAGPCDTGLTKILGRRRAPRPRRTDGFSGVTEPFQPEKAEQRRAFSFTKEFLPFYWNGNHNGST